MVVANGFFPFPLPRRHIIKAIEKYGFEARVIRFDLKNKRNVVTYSATIACEVRMARRRSGRRVDLISTSMGAVAGLHAIMFNGIADHVRRFVAAGAPYDGSPVAAFFKHIGMLVGCEAPGQMTRGSPLLKRLKATPLPQGPEYFSFGGLYDGTCPIPTHELEGAKNIRHPFSHKDIMFRSWFHGIITELYLRE